MSKQNAISQEIPRLRRMSQGIQQTMNMFPTTKIIAWGNVQRQKLEKEIHYLEKYFRLERSLG